MISLFSQEMMQWFTENPSLDNDKDLDKMQEFVNNHILLINKQDAEVDLPQLTYLLDQVISVLNIKHPLPAKIQLIQENLLAQNALSFQDLLPEIHLNIQEHLFKNKVLSLTCKRINTTLNKQIIIK